MKELKLETNTSVRLKDDFNLENILMDNPAPSFPRKFDLIVEMDSVERIRFRYKGQDLTIDKDAVMQFLKDNHLIKKEEPTND